MMPTKGSKHWSARMVLRRAIEVVRNEGIAALWFKVLGETVYRRAIVIERRLEEPIDDVAARVPVVLGLLDEKQIEEYVRLRPEADPREVLRRLREGQLCHTASHDGRLVYVSWASMRRAWIEYLEREIELAPEEVYSYEVFAAPEFRGTGIMAATGVFRLRYFRDRGYRRIIAVVMPENKRAFRAFVKLGYRSCGTMGYVRIGPWRREFSRTHTRHTGDDPNWGGSLTQVQREGHYLDPFLARLKKEAHAQLIERWGGVPRQGLTLKTDLFEEATGVDAFLQGRSNADRVVGMDVSPTVVLCAKEREPLARQLAADVRDLPFAASSFALVISPSTLDHFADGADLARSLGELARVLTPGGRLIITLDNPQNVLDPLLRLANRLGWLPFYVGQTLTIRELCHALESIGLTVSDTTAILHNPRLAAVALKMLANRIGWRPLTGWVERALVAAQRLGDTRLRYWTGSFIAALAVRPEEGHGKLAD